MKRISSKITSVCFAVVLVVCSVITAFAEENQGVLKINEKTDVEVGKTVTYTLYLSDTVEPIVGFEMRLFYDSDFLEYQKGSLKFEKFDVVVYNEDIKGRIPMNCSSLTNLPNFSEKGQFVSASFKVLKEGNASITYFFTELYGENMEYLKSFKFTYDLSVDGKVVQKDGIPPVNTDSNTLENNQGDFINYADGMGEDNSPKGDDHQQVGSAVQNNVVEVTRVINGDTADAAKEEKGGFPTFLLFIFIPLIVGAIVAAVVVVSVRGKREKDDTTSQNF